MKRKPWALMIGAIMIAVAVGSCGNNPANADAKGTLGGRVGLMGENWKKGFSATGDFSGITVAMQGTPYSTTTAANGTWSIKNLPQGTYILTMSKQGYMTYVDSSFQFVGGGTVTYDRMNNGYYLWRRPDYTVTSFSASVDRDRNVIFTGAISSPPVNGISRDVTVFYSTTSPASRSASFGSDDVELPGPGAQINGSSHSQLTLPSGTRVYMVAYPGPSTINGGHDGLQFYPLNILPASNEVSIMIP
ncbi:MAG: Carboxypeptidase regulatory-like domain [Chlorobi bacterium]|nr:Carboxypeptidase regulatory-like domain [Chlorobiota bacterium]